MQRTLGCFDKRHDTEREIFGSPSRGACFAYRSTAARSYGRAALLTSWPSRRPFDELGASTILLHAESSSDNCSCSEVGGRSDCCATANSGRSGFAAWKWRSLHATAAVSSEERRNPKFAACDGLSPRWRRCSREGARALLCHVSSCLARALRSGQAADGRYRGRPTLFSLTAACYALSIASHRLRGSPCAGLALLPASRTYNSRSGPARVLARALFRSLLGLRALPHLPTPEDLLPYAAKLSAPRLISSNWRSPAGDSRRSQ